MQDTMAIKHFQKRVKQIEPKPVYDLVYYNTIEQYLASSAIACYYSAKYAIKIVS